MTKEEIEERNAKIQKELSIDFYAIEYANNVRNTLIKLIGKSSYYRLIKGGKLKPTKLKLVENYINNK